jgi:WD repeat-containing protein 61
MKVNAQKIKELEGHKAAIYTIAEGYNENMLLSAGSERFVAEWNLDEPELARVIAKSAGVIYSQLVLRNNKTLLLGNDKGGIHVISLEKNVEIKYLLGHEKGVFDMLLHPRLNLVFVAGADGKVSIWDAEDFHFISELKLCEKKIRQFALSPDGNRLAIACGDNFIRILNTSSHIVEHEFEAHTMSVNSICFSPDGNHILSGGKDAMLKIWDSKRFELIKEIPAHNYAIYSIVFHPDGKLFATGSRDKTIKIWDASTFDFLLRLDAEKFEGHKNSVNKLVWSNHDDLLISAGDDRKIMLWKIS